MADKYCVKCGTLNRLNASRCKRCGEEFVAEVPCDQPDGKKQLEAVSINPSLQSHIFHFTLSFFIKLLFVVLFIVVPIVLLISNYSDFWKPYDASTLYDEILWLISALGFIGAFPFILIGIFKAMGLGD